MTQNMNPVDKKKLENALKDFSASMTRTEAERDLQKNIKDDICEELQLNKKVFMKLARTYHKDNYTEEMQLHDEFEQLGVGLGLTGGDS